ncbi:SusE domain-containing protein [Proteiniphilum sp. UBA5384]|jgi:hypothetical protein|uniref:SusE domain-containing protein n=1 Tax=Proteiniphilum sp. UBA5384 TaxID=1947279 RepID=UPI0025E0DBB8|nr:SusE domain-containing protein [Proteiniphilum sp. UBA5384]
MKKITTYWILIISLHVLFTGCGDSMGETDLTLTEVKTLIEPMNEKSIELLPAASASVYFEWEHAKIDGGPAIYQIAFDRTDGNFSNPLYVAYSGNNGFNNNITLSHKQLNKIMGMAGVEPSSTGTIKWTVFSSKGTHAAKATQENSLTITRLAGFAEEDIPVDLFVTGEASEGGTDPVKAHKMKAVSTGEFEVYTKLKAGKPFYFVNAVSGTPNRFSIADDLVKKEGTSTVSSEGIYRITLDFNTGASTVTQVTRVAFYFSPEGKILFDIPYIGYGVFQTRETVTFKQEGWGRDERYKFRMFVKEDAGAGEEKELEWGTLNQTDSRPTASSPESYYYLKLMNPTRWDNKWKLMGDFDNNPGIYTIYLQADKPYTHSITKP